MQYEAERYQEILRDLMVKMWTAAEIRYEEFQSMDGMTDILANHGYQDQFFLKHDSLASFYI